MSNKNLIVLGVVAAATAAVAVVLSYRAGGGSTAAEMTNLIQGLDPANLSAIVVGAGKESITLKREGGQFVLVEKDGYPAAMGPINKLVTSCLDLQAGRRVTSDPGNFDALEVTEDKAQAYVKFLDASGKCVTGLIVGKAVPKGQGSYVRALDSNDVYVSKEMPYFQTRAMDYIDSKLLPAGAGIKPGEIESITMSGPKGSFTLKVQTKAPKGRLPGTAPAYPPEAGRGWQVVLENAPPGKKLKQAEADYVPSRLEGMTFTDVMRASSPAAAKLKFDRKVVVRTQTGIFTLDLAAEGESYHVKCTAWQAGGAAGQSDVKAFNDAHAGWVYKVDKWMAEDLTKDLPDLLEDLAPATKPATNPATKPATQPASKPAAAEAGAE